MGLVGGPPGRAGRHHRHLAGGRAPPSSGRARRAALELLPEGPPRTAMELGAGWGGLAFALAQARPDWRVIAVEAALLPWLFCRIRACLSPLDNLEVRRGDLFAMDLSGVDLFTCYLLPDAMARLQQKLLDQAAGAVVSVGFGLRGGRRSARSARLPHGLPVPDPRVIVGLSILLGPALAASPAPGPDAPSEAAAQAWLDDAATLTVNPAPQTLLPGTLRVGDATLHIVGGQARAIWSGAAPGGAPARVVGAVFVGRATLHTPVPQPQALALANRLVGWLGAPRSVGDPLAAEGELRLEAVEGVILSPDVAAALQPDGGTDPEALAPLGPLFERRARLLRGELQRRGPSAGTASGWTLGEPRRPSGPGSTSTPASPSAPSARSRPRRPAPDDGWLGLVLIRSRPWMDHPHPGPLGARPLGRAGCCCAVD